MPRNEHLVLCGGLVQPRGGRASIVNLNLYGAAPNVRLRITDISRRLVKNVPDVLFDLLEIASYVYSADAVVSRGGKTDAQMGASWRRKYRFVIPVRQPDLWSPHTVLVALAATLSFVSEDAYELEFRPLQHTQPLETYFDFTEAADAGL